MSGSRAGELNKGGTFDLRLGIKRIGKVSFFLLKYCYISRKSYEINKSKNYQL